VASRGVEGLLEALADAAVGLADQALELGQRRLEVGALRLELLDVLDRLLVLPLGERVDGPELLAAAGQALDARLELLAPLGRQLLVERGGDLRRRVVAEVGRDPRELRAALARHVARLLRAHPRAGAEP